MITVNLKDHEVKIDGTEKYLPRAEFEIAVKFGRMSGRLLTREDLIGHNEKIQSRTIDQHVARMRRKFGHKHGIETVQGYGYKSKNFKVIEK